MMLIMLGTLSKFILVVEIEKMVTVKVVVAARII
jgi:hypothetical protein